VSDDLASHHYVHGHDRGGHRERGFLHPGRRMADVGRLRAGIPAGAPLHDAGVLLRDNDRVHHDPYPHDHGLLLGLSVPDHGERNVRGRLCLACHGPCPFLCPCPHDHPGHVRDGLGERSGDVPYHRDDGESAL